MARYWLHIEAGLVVGALIAGTLPREDEAQALGEWLLDGIVPVLRDLGDAPLRMNCPVPVPVNVQAALFPLPAFAARVQADDIARAAGAAPGRG